ncbi:putative MFS sugar transporter [Aspergillus alliaceus]|uniref:putative MFS sugar transporter n=1 Tax=Petromyces alliaceus TaxID=209559 RepID=UPI0012A58C0D|nr:major facilitator superfamily domain-containing protein [Aspergillus alliaceus]KAB8235027.1 major facilitator superfamily domain-containing protein [Aspergillus alliaceus]
MGYTTLWKRLSPRQVNFLIQTFSVVSILFEGYDQGVMGGVNASPTYVAEVGIGKLDGTVTGTTQQGGLVSIYYLGCIFGCFAGGWLADRLGRINGLLFGSLFALVGGALQASIQSSDFMLVARVVTGIGTGALTGITPALVNLGISVAYWLSFGLSFINHGYSDFGWRFLLAFQCIPALILVICIKALPDSPRYLVSAGRNDEARDLLNRIRCHRTSQKEIDREYLEILPNLVCHDSFGKGGRPGANLGRRAWLCILLQIMASWTGITAVTAYSPVLLSQAGYSETKQSGLAGGLNSIGIIGTITSAQIVDRLGRRKCLVLGSAGSLYEGSLRHPDKAIQYAPGAVAMLFLFNLGNLGHDSLLIPTEIFPSDLRAQGNGFGITGWAIGVGMTTLINPIMFGNIKSRSYFLLAGLNLCWVPIVYLFYPETRNRSLESIEALFSTPSPFYWEMERAYYLHGSVLVERIETMICRPSISVLICIVDRGHIRTCLSEQLQ